MLLLISTLLALVFSFVFATGVFGPIITIIFCKNANYFVENTLNICWDCIIKQIEKSVWYPGSFWFIDFFGYYINLGVVNLVKSLHTLNDLIK